MPLTSSVISGFHLIEFLKLGNSIVLAITIAIIYEICSIATLYAIVIMNRLNPYFVWSAFLLITFMQYIGNIFYSFDFILTKTIVDSNFVNHALRFLDIVVGKSRDSDINIFILSCIIGIPIPTLSLFLTKSLTEYLKKEETPKIEPILASSSWQMKQEDLEKKYNETLENMGENHKKHNEETLLSLQKNKDMEETDIVVEKSEIIKPIIESEENNKIEQHSTDVETAKKDWTDLTGAIKQKEGQNLPTENHDIVDSEPKTITDESTIIHTADYSKGFKKIE